MGKNNIIEINGRRYNAKTGELLSDGSSHAVANAATPTHTTAKTIPVREVTDSEPAPKSGSANAAKVRVHDAVKAHPQSRQPQHSKTLMRGSVAKPSDSLKRDVKVQGHIDALVDKPAARLQQKTSAIRLDSRRLTLAQNTPKSQAVSRFSKNPAGPSPKPPLHIPQPTHKPHSGPLEQRSATPRPQVRQVPTATADILERALQNATSHEQTYSAPKRRRLPSPVASVTIIVAALIIMGGFLAYQNMTNIKVHLASSKAGFAANAPDYQPAGYRLSHLNAAPGVVALNFQNDSSNRSYAVTEKTSDWDSDALRDSFLAISGQTYQTVQAAGQTLFIYGQNAATWVNGGIWYQVQSNGNLSNQQLVQLATSL